MRLFVVRHGRAGAAATDAERKLTRDGADGVRRVARRLAKMGERTDAILCSPLTRARETADILAAELGMPPVIVSPALASGSPVAAILGAIRENASRQALMIVGHNPEFGDLAVMLAGKDGPLELAAGQVVCLNLPAGPGGDKPAMLYTASPEDPA